MNNRIDARVVFSFKGETYTPSATINLDAMMEEAGHLRDFHSLLAKENNIDTYSYLYEVMDAHAIQFDNATGLAKSCLIDGQFDIKEFEHLWREEKELEILRAIARRHLEVDDLEQHPELKTALREAYNAGKAR